MSLQLQETASTTDKPCTYEDYRKLPEGAPYQLIGGELVLTPSPTTYHQIISMKLGFQMVDFVSKNGLGIVLFAPIDVYLEETETYQPDIIFIAQERMEIIEPARINGAPDLVVEILSPSTAYYDLRKKYKVYEKCGVREYWIVDPDEKSVELFLLNEAKFALDQEAAVPGTVSSRLLEGFTVPLQTIF
jgi:Uma2 family endonuclease